MTEFLEALSDPDFRPNPMHYVPELEEEGGSDVLGAEWHIRVEGDNPDGDKTDVRSLLLDEATGRIINISNILPELPFLGRIGEGEMQYFCEEDEGIPY